MCLKVGGGQCDIDLDYIDLCMDKDNDIRMNSILISGF